MTYNPEALRQLARNLRDPALQALGLPTMEEVAAALLGAADEIEKFQESS
jgi:hypothetical protein